MYAADAYHTILKRLPYSDEIETLAERVHAQVFRTDFRASGFALVTFGLPVESRALRHIMVMLKDALAALRNQKTGGHLEYVSLLRFDQQATTKFHLDGAPDESVLMLGYEPSAVQSELRMADYTQAAHTLGLTPKQYLVEYNPLFLHGERQLAPYVTRLDGFDTTLSHVLLVNNSRLPYSPEEANTLGVMHQATIVTPDPTQSRIVNSTMLALSNSAVSIPAIAQMQQIFLTTEHVSGSMAKA